MGVVSLITIYFVTLIAIASVNNTIALDQISNGTSSGPNILESSTHVQSIDTPLFTHAQHVTELTQHAGSPVHSSPLLSGSVDSPVFNDTVYVLRTPVQTRGVRSILRSASFHSLGESPRPLERTHSRVTFNLSDVMSPGSSGKRQRNGQSSNIPDNLDARFSSLVAMCSRQTANSTNSTDDGSGNKRAIKEFLGFIKSDSVHLVGLCANYVSLLIQYKSLDAACSCLQRCVDLLPVPARNRNHSIVNNQS
eukprot:24506_1